MKNGYIYKISNLVSGKCYIGFTQYPENRWLSHQRNEGSKLVFQAIKKYGLENLIFEVIAGDSLENEDYYIQEHNSMYPNGYNLTSGGNIPPNHKGKTYEEIYGVEGAREQRKKRAKLQKERGGYGPVKHTLETRKKISESVSGKKNPMYGKKQSDETKMKISSKIKGRYNGGDNPNSCRWKLTDPIGTEYIISGTLKQFCIDHNLKYATVRKSYEINRPMRNKWKIEKIS